MAGKRSITSKQELNDALCQFLIDITKVGASSKSDVFDETVRQILRDNLSGAKYISTEQWSDKEGIFYEHYRTSLTYNFNFTHLPKIVDNGKPLNLLIIDKPNGSQKWPDLLIVYDGIGLPLEVKSAKEDKITWNSGIPRSGGVYIFNCYGRSKTTCFLGEHAINDEELLLLKERARNATKENGKLGDRWSYYVRDMNISGQTFFENEKDLISANKKEMEIFETTNNIDKKLAKKTLTEHDKKLIHEWQERVIKLRIESVDLHEKHSSEQETRIKYYEETKDYLRTLTWDYQQKTDFKINLSEVNDLNVSKNRPKI